MRRQLRRQAEFHLPAFGVGFVVASRGAVTSMRWRMCAGERSSGGYCAVASGCAAASMLWLMCGGERKCGCKRAAASGVAVASVPLLLCRGKRQAAALLQACGGNIAVASKSAAACGRRRVEVLRAESLLPPAPLPARPGSGDGVLFLSLKDIAC